MRALIAVALSVVVLATAAPARADDAATLDAIHADIKQALAHARLRKVDLAAAQRCANLAMDLEDQLRANRPVTQAQLNVLIAAIADFQVTSMGVVPDAVLGMRRWSDALGTMKGKQEFARQQQAEADAERAASARAEKARRDAEERKRVEAEELANTTITHRFPQLTAADAADPAKVAQAFALAPPEMIYAVPAGLSGSDRSFAPTGNEGACSDDNDGATRPVTVGWRHNGQNSGIEVDGPSAALRDGEPVLIWERRDLSGVVVTADGGRWTLGRLDKLVPTSRPYHVPTAVTGLCLTELQIGELERAGRVAAGTTVRITRARQDAETCAERVWRSSQPQFDANDAANITDSTRGVRYSMLLDRTDARVVARCASQRKKVQVLLDLAVAARTLERTKTLAAVTARLQQDLTAPAAPSPPTPSTPPSP